MAALEEFGREYLVWSGRDPHLSMQTYRRMLAEWRRNRQNENESAPEVYDVNDLWLQSPSLGMLGWEYAFGDHIKQFCTTTKGYMAWVPAETQAGDLLCLLFGGSTPFILRQMLDGTYRMLGTAYVHGLLYGDGMARDEWAEENTQTFKSDCIVNGLEFKNVDCYRNIAAIPAEAYNACKMCFIPSTNTATS